jgi:hypothetical protein
MGMTSIPRMAFALAFSSAAIGLAAEGCGSGGGRYYCDATGCFDCDGYGCTPVKPPAATPCSGNSGCQQGETCTSNGCARNCNADTDCAKGLVCNVNSHLCVAPGTDPGMTVECSTKADCKGGVCISGKCVACGGTNGPCACDSKNTCDQGQICSEGYCTAVSNTCKYSSECAMGKVCADGQCLQDCSMGQMCSSSTICDKGVCKPDPNTNNCKTNGDCGMGQVCAQGKCAPQCTSDAMCGAGKFCDQGACVTDNRPVTQCGGITGNMCDVNQQCIGGYCKYTCSTDQECKLIDARIGYCGKDKVCRTQAEATAECLQSSDCMGKICIANVCK